MSLTKGDEGARTGETGKHQLTDRGRERERERKILQARERVSEGGDWDSGLVTTIDRQLRLQQTYNPDSRIIRQQSDDDDSRRTPGCLCHRVHGCNASSAAVVVLQKRSISGRERETSVSRRSETMSPYGWLTRQTKRRRVARGAREGRWRTTAAVVGAYVSLIPRLERQAITLFTRFLSLSLSSLFERRKERERGSRSEHTRGPNGITTIEAG